MKKLFYQPLGYLADTGTTKGLGVFATRAIKAGETVEVAPVIQIRCAYSDLSQELKSRVFHWERLTSSPGVQALALGYGSLYNHANPANMRYVAIENGTAISFVAASDIDEGDELTINYNDTGGEPVSSEDNWFKLQGITPYSPNEGDA